ncbi:MAG TPA: LPS export ABC transporter periplasmic protein LptC [Gammaproteobacteria bacterium]|nr:LPS export ABC transporter periplasmic protein LptC [Gammaproteobacteria bacterium]
MQRISLFLIPGLIAVVVFVVISSFESVSNVPDPQHDQAYLKFDAYSAGINTVLYARDGTINYTLQATSQTHYSDEARTELKNPLIQLYQQGNSRWNIVANSGRISATPAKNDTTTHLIELLGNVEAYNIDEFGNRTVLSSEFLSLNPQMETLETDQAVTLVTTNFRQTSIGMFVDLTTEKIFFHRSNRGSYERMSN